tara:strand:+ start:53 stop:199 length:147 start_codon:yes stop_codon:yes gene_type:complete
VVVVETLHQVLLPEQVVLVAAVDGIKQVLLETHPQQVLHKDQMVVMDK